MVLTLFFTLSNLAKNLLSPIRELTLQGGLGLGLLQYADFSGTQTVGKTNLPMEATTIDLPPIWPHHSTQGCTNAQRGGLSRKHEAFYERTRQQQSHGDSEFCEICGTKRQSSLPQHVDVSKKHSERRPFQIICSTDRGNERVKLIAPELSSDFPGPDQAFSDDRQI
ncbi:unnamed protein product [Leptidea sinapis]|uniref:Uncharacterized protein n=1 Tax=Leptidea sinapis TaxID=189913 RepID=A0A5E4QCC0_9NEOP|nr:unnamed protein product [Leptidea sinapis]